MNARVRPRVPLPVVLSASVLIASACTPGYPASSAPSPEPTTPPASTSPRAIIDWIDFVYVGGVMYQRVPTEVALTDGDLGAEVATVRVTVSESVTDPFSYSPAEGDAAFLTVATPLHVFRDYVPTFRLAARQDGRILLYEADSNPSALRGSDLLDLDGRVDRISINSETDGRTELAAIDQHAEIEALVELVLAAPVDQSRLGADGDRYVIAFHLTDGTQVTRVYWVESGELSRGIMVPSGFSEAIQRALAGR